MTVVEVDGIDVELYEVDALPIAQRKGIRYLFEQRTQQS
jgi:hypothetical protein